MNGTIEAIEGTLGGGKSAFAFERILEHLQDGGYAFTNIEYYPELIAQHFASKGLVFEPSRLVFLDGSMKDFHSRVARGNKDTCVMVVIDEAHLDFNALDWSTVDRDLVNFATLCRKFDIELLFLTQDVNNLVKQFRRMIQVLWQCRNLRRLRLFGVVPCPIPLFVRVRYDCTMGNKPVRQDAEYIIKSPSWGLYNSDALLGPNAKKFSAMKRLNASPLKTCKKTNPPKLFQTTPWRLLPLIAAFLSALTFYVWR